MSESTLQVSLPDGASWPALGLGTWRMGESPSSAAAEEAAVRTALEIGYRLIDTAEMYGEGGAESVVGRALRGALNTGLKRDELIVVSKVYPHNAGRAAMRSACERSLRRLQVEQIDLYLLHWRGSVPLAETVLGFEDLQRRGWIRRWGVSNFDVDDLHELDAVPGGTACSANQVYYSLSERGVEFALAGVQRARSMPLMAYSPIDQGALAGAAALRAVAARHSATPAQVALAWLVAHPGVIVIPKAVRADHLRHNWDAMRLQLDDPDRAAIDAAFPPPKRKRDLAMI